LQVRRQCRKRFRIDAAVGPQTVTSPRSQRIEIKPRFCDADDRHVEEAAANERL
jgi:hypothetical protein